MKRIISCILCMILVLSLLPAGSFASVTTRVYCNAPGTWERCFVYYWGDSGYSEVHWPGVSMERDEKGIWYYDVPYEATKLIFNNGLGTQTADLDLPADGRNMYDFQERCWTEYGWKPYVPVYYVAGVEELCGIAWDPGASENKMTYVDGIYTKTYTDVAAGTYEFKITNGTWNWSWGASNGVDNYIFTVEQDNSAVVITFDPAKPLVNVDVMGPGIPPEDYLISEGIMNFISKQASIFGISINFTPVSDGTVTISVLEMDDDYLIDVFTDDVFYTEFSGNNAPDTLEFSVQANVPYEVEFKNVRHEDETFKVCQPMIGAMTYRMTSDVPVNGVIRWPYEDPGMILQEVYHREDSLLLGHGATLVGEITKVVTPYDPKTKNITVEMVVPGYESMPVQCYRMSGDGVEDLVIGDSIVVSGFLTAHRGTVQFDQGCSLDIVLNDYLDVPTPTYDPPELVDIAYALKSGERHPYVSTLTGKIVSIDVPYSDTYQNITVTIAVEGRENKPIVCYRLKGDGGETLEVGDVITVEGILQKCVQCDVNSGLLFESVEFDASSRLVGVSQKDQESTQVYCYTPWEQCYVYFWSASNFECNWPGMLMTDEGNGLWSYEIPGGTEYLIFNSGDGLQTWDLRVPTDLRILYDVKSEEWTELFLPEPDDQSRSLTLVAPEHWGQLYIYTWDPQVYGEFPGKALSMNGDLYCDEISSQLEFMVISAAEPGGGYYDTGVIDLRTGTDGVTVIIEDVGSYTVCYDECQEDVYRVVGNADWMGNWYSDSDAGLMTRIDDGVYQAYFEKVQPGHYEFRITVNGVWDDSIGYGDYSNFTLDLSKTSNVYVTYYEESGAVDIYHSRSDGFGPDSLALVGTGLPGINEWDPADPAGDMTEIADLVYQKTLTFKAGTFIEFKIVGNDSWNEQWNLGGTDLVLNQIAYLNSSPYDCNLQLYLEEDCRLVFTVDLRPMLDGDYATLLVERLEPPTPEQGRFLTVLAPDSWNNAYIYTWDPVSYGDFPGMVLSYDGTYYWKMISSQETNMVISGYRDDGTLRMTNDIHLSVGIQPVTIVIREDGTHTVIYNDGSPTEGAYRVVGNTSWMGLWDAASNAGIMEEISEGFYQKCFKNVRPGAYEFKITKDGKWDHAIGEADGQNFKFVVSRTSDVYITCAFDTGDALVYCDIAPKPMGDMNGDGKRNMGDVAKLYGHVRGTNPVMDSQILINADMNSDGKLNIGDTARIYAFVRGTDSIGIVDAAYALAPGATLSGLVTLTGEIQSIVIDYSSQRDDIDVQIILKGREDMPILCHGLKGAGIENLAVGDVITVMGTITKHQYSTGISVVQFDAGCTLKAVEK